MNRPASVTATVILLAIGGLLCLLMAGLMVFSLFMIRNTPAAGPEVPTIFLFFPIVLFGGLGVWTLVTAVGVWQLRPWGRMSLLVFSGFLVVLQGLGALFILFMPFPTQDARAEQIMSTVRIAVAGFYLLQVAIGVWWLVYFNRPSAKSLFAGDAPPDEKPSRPLSITIIAWHFVVGALGCALLAWLQWPAVFLGRIFHGWQAIATYLLFAGVTGFLGVALLKLHPRAVDWSIYYGVFMTIHATVVWSFSNTTEQMRELMKEIPLPQPPNPDAIPVIPTWVSVLIGAATIGAYFWYLVTRKQAYLVAVRAAGTLPENGLT